jgi:energy-coupling factor transporter ATP-binding protein EcfA2
MAHLIQIQDLRKTYVIGDEPVHALDGVSLSIDYGEFVAIMGSSGSGKSTMLNILGCLDAPTSGSYLLDGTEVAERSAAQLAKIETIHTRVEYDDGAVEGDFFYGSMSNSTSVAGIVRLKDTMVSLGDGLSELVLVKDPGSVEGFGELVGSVLSQRFDSEHLIILHTRRARFTFDKPVAWTRDGEAGGEHTCVELCNYHAPVKLIF